VRREQTREVYAKGLRSGKTRAGVDSENAGEEDFSEGRYGGAEWQARLERRVCVFALRWPFPAGLLRPRFRPDYSDPAKLTQQFDEHRERHLAEMQKDVETGENLP